MIGKCVLLLENGDGVGWAAVWLKERVVRACPDVGLEVNRL